MSVRFGSEYIESTQTSDGKEQIDVIFASSIADSLDKIYIGGMPLTIAEYDSTKRILQVVVDSSGTYSNDSTIFDGFTLAVNRRNGAEGQYNLSVNESIGSVGTVSITQFKGHPFAISENKELLVEEVSGTISEYVTFIFGSLMLEAALINTDYYLVVSE